MGHAPAPIPASEPPVSQFGSGLRKRNVFFFGMAYGLLMRALFGMPLFEKLGLKSEAASGPMLASFTVVVPMLIGALTVYYSGGRTRSFGYSLVAPWIPVLLFVAGTALLMIEGSICIAMALPIFLFTSSLGGVLMWAALKWIKPSPAIMPSLLVLPLLTGAWEGGQPMPVRIQDADASVHVAATPEAIWNLINDARAIRPDEMRDGLAWKIGVPHPQSALTVDTPAGRVRKLAWDKGVHFDEPITDWQQNRYIRWRYVFAPDSFPDGALDDHVRIGGRYFDLVDTSYRLTPEAGGTRLDIHVTYRVSTEFNWYAGPAGRLLVDDAARQILAFYKHRSESAAGTTP